MIEQYETLRARMIDYVCDGSDHHAPPANWIDTRPVDLSEDHVAIPYPIGGLIVRKDSRAGRKLAVYALPVSKNAVAGARADWVVVQLGGHLVAVHLAEAYRRNLRQEPWSLPDTSIPASTREEWLEQGLAGMAELFAARTPREAKPEHDQGQLHLAGQCATVDMIRVSEQLREILSPLLDECRGRWMRDDGERRWMRRRLAWQLLLNIFEPARAKELQAKHLERMSLLPFRSLWQVSVDAYVADTEI